MRITLIIVGFLFAGLVQAGQSTGPQISKDFRKSALKSVEANRRLAAASLDVMIATGPGSSPSERREKESEYAQVKLDAGKLLTDAKVEADTRL